MNFAPDLATVTHGIDLAVAPVFLLTAVSGMIAAVAGRPARIMKQKRFASIPVARKQLSKEKQSMAGVDRSSRRSACHSFHLSGHFPYAA